MLVYHVNTRLGFEVFMAINITIKVLWNVSPRRLVSATVLEEPNVQSSGYTSQKTAILMVFFFFFLIYLRACVFSPFPILPSFFSLTYF